MEKRMKSGFSFLILGAKVLVPAFPAARCTDCIAGVTVHAYFYIE